MSGRKSTFFYGVLIALASLVVGMVIASRLDLTPRSLAGTVSVPAANSAPLTGPIDATTFRTIAHNAGPAVVSIVIESTRPVRSFGDFFGLPDQSGGGRNRGGQGQGQERRNRPGRRQRLHLRRQGRLHPHEQSRRRGRQARSRSTSTR